MSQGLETIGEIGQPVWIALFEQLRCDISNQLRSRIFSTSAPAPVLAIWTGTSSMDKKVTTITFFCITGIRWK